MKLPPRHPVGQLSNATPHHPSSALAVPNASLISAAQPGDLESAEVSSDPGDAYLTRVRLLLVGQNIWSPRGVMLPSQHVFFTPTNPDAEHEDNIEHDGNASDDQSLDGLSLLSNVPATGWMLSPALVSMSPRTHASQTGDSTVDGFKPASFLLDSPTVSYTAGTGRQRLLSDFSLAHSATHPVPAEWLPHTPERPKWQVWLYYLLPCGIANASWMGAYILALQLTSLSHACLLSNLHPVIIVCWKLIRRQPVALYDITHQHGPPVALLVTCCIPSLPVPPPSR